MIDFTWATVSLTVMDLLPAEMPDPGSVEPLHAGPGIRGCGRLVANHGRSPSPGAAFRDGFRRVESQNRRLFGHDRTPTGYAHPTAMPCTGSVLAGGAFFRPEWSK